MVKQWRSSRHLVVLAVCVAMAVPAAWPGRGSAMDLTGNTGVPLTLAAAQGDLQKVHSLLIAGTSPNLTDESGRPAIGWAALEGHTAIIEELLKAPRIQPNATDAQGNTALILAAQRDHADAVDALIRGKVNLNAYNRDGMTAMILAAQNGFVQIVKELVKAGADTTIQDNTGRTALDWAQDNSRQDVISVLQRASSK
jgi:serine/threonine-protein phosphatase 6 regulatory ankyrin repeat subunit B